jgi:hypothetical protein
VQTLQRRLQSTGELADKHKQTEQHKKGVQARGLTANDIASGQMERAFLQIILKKSGATEQIFKSKQYINVIKGQALCYGK